LKPVARGFTLVEALVALVILGIIAVMAYRGTAALSSGEAQLAQESARWRTLDGVFTRLEADLRQAVARTSRRGDSTEAAWSLVPDASGSTALVFSRAGPEFALEPGVAGQRIGYRLRDGAVELLYWPQLDNVAGATPAGYALIGGVARFRVTALTSDNQWSERWPLRVTDGVPRAARVELTLSDGSALERWFALQ
jgi:general secretion pathway protein J